MIFLGPNYKMISNLTNIDSIVKKPSTIQSLNSTTKKAKKNVCLGEILTTHHETGMKRICFILVMEEWGGGP